MQVGTSTKKNGKVWTRLKQSIYELIHRMLRQTSQGIWSFVLLSTLSYIQLLKFNFHPYFIDSYNLKDFWEVIPKITIVLEMRVLFEEISWGLHLGIFLLTFIGLLFILLCAAYQAYALHKFNLSYSWILSLLNLTLRLILSILFLPLLETMLSMLDCSSRDNDDLVLTQHNDVSCFTLTHTLIALLAIIGMILLIGGTLVGSMLYFESYKHTKDIAARIHSVPHTLRIIIISLLQIIYTFFTENAKFLMISMSFIPWLLLFIFYFRTYQFYSKKAALIHEIFLGLRVWAGFHLMIITIFDTKGAFLHFLIGILLTIAGVIISDLMTLSRATLGIKNIKTPIEQVSHAEKVLHALCYTKEDRITRQMGFSYLANHEKKCKYLDTCSLINAKKQTAGSIKNKNHISTIELKTITKIFESKDVNLLHVRNLYQITKRDYPSSILVRLMYIQFVMGEMQNLEFSIEEISELEQLELNLGAGGILHHFKRVLDEDIFQHRKGIHVDLESYLQYESYEGKLRRQILSSANMFMQLWGVLDDQKPDLPKLQNLGFGIHALDDRIQAMYLKIIDINPTAMKITKIYAEYVVEVLNDPLFAKGIQDQCKKMNQIAHLNTGLNLSLTSFEEYFKDGNPCFCVSYGTTNSQVMQCNQSMSSIFGHERKDILGMGVDFLFPKIYCHLLMEILEQLQGKRSHSKSEFNFFGKSKAGYIFPCQLIVLESPSYSNKFCFIIMITIDKKLFKAEFGYLLMDTEFSIRDLSSACISLGLSRTQLFKFETLQANMILKGFGRHNLAKLLSSDGMVLNYIPPPKEFRSGRAKDIPEEVKEESTQKSFPGPNTREEKEESYESLAPEFKLSTNIMPLSMINDPKSPDLPRVSVTAQNEVSLNSKTTYLKCRLTKIEYSGKSFGYYLEFDNDTNIIKNMIHLPKPGERKTSNDISSVDKSKGFQIRFDDHLNRFVREFEQDEIEGKLLAKKIMFEKKLQNREHNEQLNLGVLTSMNFEYIEDRSDSECKSDRSEDQNIIHINYEEKYERGLADLEERNDFYSQLSPKIKIVNEYITRMVLKGSETPIEKIDIFRLLEKSYPVNIATKTIMNGVQVAIGDRGLNELEIMNQDEKAELRNKMKNKKLKGKEDYRVNFLLSNNIKGRREFQDMLTQNVFPRQLSILAIFLIFFWILAFAIACVENIYEKRKIDDLELALKISRNNLELDVNYQFLLHFIREIQLLAENRVHNYTYLYENMNKTEYYDYVQNEIKYHITNMSEIIQNRKQDSLKLNNNDNILSKNSERDQFFALVNYDKTIEIRNVSYYEGMILILSAAYQIASTPINETDPKHSNFFLTIENGLNEFFFTHINTNWLYYDYYKDESHKEKSDSILNISLYMIIAIAIIMFPISVCLLNSIHNRKTRIFVLFLDIPKILIRNLHGKCEKLIKLLQYQKDINVGEFEDDQEELEDQSQVSVQEEDEESSSLILLRPMNIEGAERKKKLEYIKPKDVFVTNKGILCFITFSLLLMIAYFSINLFVSEEYLKNLHNFGLFYRDIGLIDPSLAGAINFEREHMINNSNRVTTLPGIGGSLYAIEYVYNGSREMCNVYKQGEEYFDTSHRRAMLDLIDGNLCENLDLFSTSSITCTQFMNGLLLEGYSVSITYLINKVNNFLREYVGLLGNITTEERDSLKYYNYQEIYEMSYLSKYLVHPITQKISSIIIEQLANNNDDHNQIYFSLLVALCAVIILLCILLKPFLNKTKNNFIKTKRMLALIPLEAILGIKNIFQYVEHSFSNYSSKNVPPNH